MRPDFEKISEKMEQASLKELMPDFDKEAEWLQIYQQLHPAKKKMPILVWYAAAASLVLLFGVIWFMLPKDTISSSHQQTIVRQSIPPVLPTVAAARTDGTVNETPAVVADNTAKEPKNNQDKNIVVVKKHGGGHKDHTVITSYTAKSFICNGTPCPIQICISQTVQCPHVEPATTSLCSTLEPDQSGKLIAHDKVAKNCSLTINELEIKSVATGETILLNTNTNPAMAKEVFSYITGQKKGDVLAGMFNSDCDQKSKIHGIRLNNKYGGLIIQ